MNPFNIHPTGWRVLVMPDAALEKSGGGVMLATISRLPACTGRLIEVSVAAKKEHPELVPGARIHFKPFGGLDFKVNGKWLKLLQREDVLALLIQRVDDAGAKA